MGCGTIAGLALTAAGTGANMYANNQVRGKMNDLTNQELARNQGFEQKAQGVFNNSLQQSTPQAANQQIGQGQQQLAGLIQNAQQVPLSSSMPNFGNVNTMAEGAKTAMSNKAASDLGGYSNYTLQQRLKDQQVGSQLGVIGSEAQGWANVLPAQLQQAQGSQQGLQALGALLSSAGLLTGLSGWGSAPTAGVNAAQMSAMGNGFGPVTSQAAAGLGGQISPLMQQQLMNQLMMTPYSL